MNLFLLACVGGVTGTVVAHALLAVVTRVPWRRIAYAVTDWIPAVHDRRAMEMRGQMNMMTDLCSSIAAESRSATEAG